MATNEIVVTHEDIETLARLHEAMGNKPGAFTLRNVGIVGASFEAQAQIVTAHRIAAEQRGYERAREQAADIALDVATCGGAGERDFERIIGDDIATAIRSMKGEGL